MGTGQFPAPSLLVWNTASNTYFQKSSGPWNTAPSQPLRRVPDFRKSHQHHLPPGVRGQLQSWSPHPKRDKFCFLDFALNPYHSRGGDKLPFPGPSRSHLTECTPQSCAVKGSKASRESQLKGPLGSAWVGTPMEHSFLNMGTARTISPRCPQVTEANGRVPAVLGQWIGMCLVNHYQEGLIAASLAALQGLEGEISLLKSVLHIWVGIFSNRRK